MGLSACGGCNEKEAERHRHEYIKVVTEPTCTAKGYSTYTCECGSKYVTDYTDPIGHEYVGDVCSRCGWIRHDHIYTKTEVAATCTEGGYTRGVCDICGATYTAYYSDPLGHDYDNGFCNRCNYFNPEEHEHRYEQSIVEPDCENSGYTAYNCKCGEGFEEGYFSSLGHDYVQGKCTRCNSVLGTEGLQYLIFETKDGDVYFICNGIFKTNDKDIIIPPEYFGIPVKEIASDAFKGRTDINSVVFFDSIRIIGDGAFRGCNSLKEVTLGDGLHTIGARAFDGCSSLTSIEIPAGVLTIGLEAFGGCESLESFSVAEGNFGYHSTDNCIIETYTKTLVFGCGNSVIPDDGSVTTIADSAFIGCGGLKSITIPGNVKEIGNSAFSSCGNLESVIIDDGVKNIGSNAFSYCENLTNLTVAGSGIVIEPYAFEWCNKIKNVTAPVSVFSEINRTALKTVKITDGESVKDRRFYGCVELESVILADSMTSIGILAFFNCSEMKSITIGNGVTSIGRQAFSYCYGLQDIYYAGTREQWDAITKGTEWDYGAGKQTASGSYTVHFMGEETVTDFEYTLSTDGTYYICSGIGTVTDTDIFIPSQYNGLPVKEIGEWAFYQCYSITSVEIENGVSVIGNNAFNVCTGVKKFEIPDSVTVIEEYAFYTCTGITKIVIPDSVTYIGNNTFFQCTQLTEVIIPSGMKSIGRYAFGWCTNLSSIAIPDGVNFIDSYAFFNCRSLTGIVIRERVTTIGYGAFEGCSSLTIYCEVKRKPDGWDNKWSGGCTIVWDCKIIDIDYEYIPTRKEY